MIGGGAIIHTSSGRAAVRRRQCSQPSRQYCTPSSMLPEPLQRAMSFASRAEPVAREQRASLAGCSQDFTTLELFFFILRVLSPRSGACLIFNVLWLSSLPVFREAQKRKRGFIRDGNFPTLASRNCLRIDAQTRSQLCLCIAALFALGFVVAGGHTPKSIRSPDRDPRSPPGRISRTANHGFPLSVLHLCFLFRERAIRIAVFKVLCSETVSADERVSSVTAYFILGFVFASAVLPLLVHHTRRHA